MAKEHKYKDKDDYKDKNKDAKRITETLTVCYITGILMTQIVLLITNILLRRGEIWNWALKHRGK